MKKKMRVLMLLPGHGKKEQLDLAQDSQPQETLFQTLVRCAPETLSFEYLDEVPRVPRTGIRTVDKLLAHLGALTRLPRILTSDIVISSNTGIAECLAALSRRAARGLFGPRWFLFAVNTSVTSRRLQAKPFRLGLLRFCWRQCAEIMCLAKFQMADFVVAGVSPERLVYVPLGVDVDFFKPDIRRPEGEYILSVGYDRGRDYEYLLRIAEQTPYPILIITSSRNIARDTILPANVTVRYDVSISEVRDALAAARIVAIPTKEEVNEGSDCSGQTVILQALAMGIPVCATVQPWTCEYLEEDKEYVALPLSNPIGAARVLAELWADIPRRAELAQAGRRAVEKRYTIPFWAKALLKRIISNGNENPADKRGEE